MVSVCSSGGWANVCFYLELPCRCIEPALHHPSGNDRIHFITRHAIRTQSEQEKEICWILSVEGKCYLHIFTGLRGGAEKIHPVWICEKPCPTWLTKKGNYPRTRDWYRNLEEPRALLRHLSCTGRCSQYLLHSLDYLCNCPYSATFRTEISPEHDAFVTRKASREFDWRGEQLP